MQARHIQLLLLEAVKNSNTELTKELITMGADIEFNNRQGNTSLYFAE